jgi:hypothetical protein
MASCPNINSPEFKALESVHGREKSTLLFHMNNEVVPTVEQVAKLLGIQGIKNLPSLSNKELYYQLGTSEIEQANKELDQFLLDYLKPFGIKVKDIEELKKRFNVKDALGVADVLNKVIYLSKGNRRIDTMAEEAAHMITMLMGRDHPLFQQLFNNIERHSSFNEVYREYMPIYNNLEQVKKEAVDKLIAEAIVNGWKVKGTKEEKNLLQKFIDAIKKWWDSFINKNETFSQYTANKKISPTAAIIAEKILSGDTSLINKVEGKEKLDYIKALSGNEHAKNTINLFTDYFGFRLTGSLAIAAQGETINRPSESPIHDLDFVVSKDFDIKKMDEYMRNMGAIPTHSGIFTKTSRGDVSSTYAYLVPAEGYTVEAAHGTTSKYWTEFADEVILRDNKGKEIFRGKWDSAPADKLLNVDFFDNYEKNEETAGKYKSWQDIYFGKMTLSNLGDKARMFPRAKDQTDYIESNPVQRDNIRPEFLYYQRGETSYSDIKLIEPTYEDFSNIKDFGERYAAITKRKNELQGQGAQISGLTDKGFRWIPNQKDDVKYQLSSASKQAPIKAVDKKVTAFIKALGGQVREVDQLIVEGSVVSGNAVVNVITRTIQVAKGKASADTLSEEAAHIYVQWLPKNSILLRDMMKDIRNRREYKEVMDEYSSNPFYQKEDGTVDEEKIAIEAIGKVIAGVIVGKYSRDIKAQSWFQRLMDWIRKTFGTAEFNEVKEDETPYERVATEILAGDISSLDLNQKFNDIKTVKNELQELIEGKNREEKNASIQTTLDFFRPSKKTGKRNENRGIVGQPTENSFVEYAKDNLIIDPKIDKESKIGKGNESVVYYKDGVVTKLVNTNNHNGSWKGLLESMLLHNRFFPDVAYTLKGFTTDENGNLLAVVEQPYVSKTAPINLNNVAEYLKELGFEPVGNELTKKYNYYNKTLGIELQDIHAENVINRDGEYYFIDTVFKTTPDFYKTEVPELDMDAVKAASQRGEYYFQLDETEKKIAEKQMKKANAVQKEIIKEVYIDVHDRIILDESIDTATGKEKHEYRDLKVVNPTIYTSASTARSGKKNIVGFDDNREWGKDFDKLLQGVILGKDLDQIEEISDRIDAVKTDAYNFLKGLISAWTADGTIALPQVIVANKNEGIPGAVPIAGSIDLLLVHPDGEMTVIDLKTSYNSRFERSYANTSYKVGEGSLLGADTQLSKSQDHSIQVMTYVKLLNLMGYPVKAARTEHLLLGVEKDKVKSFTYEGPVNRVMSENEVSVDKIVPKQYEGKNRLDELNEKYQTGNPTHRSSFGETKEEKAERLATDATMEDAILRLFTAAEGWQKYLEDLRHQSIFEVKDDSIRKIDHLITQMQTLFAQGKKEQIYPKFLSVFNTHITSVLKVINDPDNIKKPGYIRTVYMSKKYIDTFRPFLVSSFAAASNSTPLFNKIDTTVRAADVAIIGAIKNTVKELVEGWTANKEYLDDNILEEVLKVDKDISGANTWLDTLGNSGVVILENAAKMLASARQTVRENVREQRATIHTLGNNLVDASGTKDPAKLFNFMYQLGANGKRNGRIISQKGTAYNTLFEKVNMPLYNLDGTRKEFIKRPSTPEQIKWNKDLYYLKAAYRDFMEAEHIEVEWVTYTDIYGNPRKTPETTVTEGKCHKYTDEFIAEREKYMEEDDFGNWKPKKGETDSEYVAWRDANFDWSNYLKADTVVDEKTGELIPTGTVSEASKWFPKKKNIVSREYAEDGTDLWDPMYRKMMQPKTALETAQSEFYKGYIDILRTQIEKLPPSAMYWFEQGYIPTLQGNFVHELSQKGANFASIVTQQMRTFFDTTAMSNQSDIAKTGTANQSIPIMFMGSLQSQKRLAEIESELEKWATKKEGMDVKKWHEKNDILVNLRKKELHKMTAEQIHPDLVLGLEAFVQMAENFNIMTAVEDTLLAVRDHLQTMKFVSANGKEIEADKANATKRLDKFLDMCFYNDPTFTKSVAEVVVQKLQKATSAISIPFNIFGTVNNKILARINNRIDAIGGDFFTHMAYNRAWKEYNTEFIPGYIATIGKKDTGKAYGDKKAGTLYEWLTDDYNMVRHAHRDQSKVDMLAWGYKGYEAAEWEAQSLIGNAILGSVQVKYTGNDPNLHDCSLRDAYTFDPNTGKGMLIDGYKFLDKEGNIAKDQDRARHMIINRIHETNDRIHGNYDSANKTMIESTLAGRLAIQFHKWVWPNFKARFQKGKFDENLGGGMDVEGRYVTLYNLFKDIAKLGDATKRWAELTPHQKNNLKKDLTDLSYFVGFFILAHIAKSIAAGVPDDDPVLKKMVNWLRYQSSRGKQEVGLFIPPLGIIESYQLVQNPFAATNALAKFAQLLNSAIEYPFIDDEDRYYQRGNFKGQLKVYKQAKDVMPIFREVNRITNLNTVTTFYVK